MFIHHAAGLTESAWAFSEAEVTYDLDAAIARQLGGADVWSDGVRGESMLRWRITSADGEKGGW